MSQGTTVFDYLDFFTLMKVVAVLACVLAYPLARIPSPVVRALAAVLAPLALALALLVPGSGSEGIGGYWIIAGAPGVLVSTFLVGLISLVRAWRQKRERTRAKS